MGLFLCVCASHISVVVRCLHHVTRLLTIPRLSGLGRYQKRQGKSQLYYACSHPLWVQRHIIIISTTRGAVKGRAPSRLAQPLTGSRPSVARRRSGTSLFTPSPSTGGGLFTFSFIIIGTRYSYFCAIIANSYYI